MMEPMFSESSSQETDHKPAIQPIRIVKAPTELPRRPLKTQVAATTAEQVNSKSQEDPQPEFERSSVPNIIEKFFQGMKAAEPMLHGQSADLGVQQDQSALCASFQPLISQNKIIQKCNCVLYAIRRDFQQLFLLAFNLQDADVVSFALYQAYLHSKASDAFCAQYLRELLHLVLLGKASASLSGFFSVRLFQYLILQRELAAAHSKALRQLLQFVPAAQRDYYANLFEIQTNLPMVPQFTDAMSFRVAVVHENATVASRIIQIRRLSAKEKSFLACSALRQNAEIQSLLGYDYAFCQLAALNLPLCGFEQKCEVRANIEAYYRKYIEYFIAGVRRGVLQQVQVADLEWTGDLDAVQRCLVIFALVEAKQYNLALSLRDLWAPSRRVQ